MTHPSFIHFTRGLKVLVSILCVLTMAASGAGVQSVMAASVAEQAADLNEEITFEDGSLTGPNGMDSATGNVVLDNTSMIQGVFSAYIPNVDSTYLQEDFAGTDDLYVSFYLKLISLPTGTVRLAQIMHEGKTLGNLILRADGALQLRHGSKPVGAETAPLTVGAIYRLALHQRQGADRNAVLEGYLAMQDEAFGEPFASTTDGNWKSPADRLRLGATDSTALDAAFDDITLGLELPTVSEPSPTPAPTNTLAAPTETPPPPTATPMVSTPTATPPPPTSTPRVSTPTEAAPSATPAVATATQAATAVASATSTSTQQSATAAVADPTNCASYSGPKRVFMDSQAWWTTTPGKTGTDHGHVHTSTCFPLHQTVSGIVPLDIRLTMHNNPGKLTSLTIYINTDSGGTIVARKVFNTALTCPVPGDCQFWVHLDADTTKAPYDGRQEWRIRPWINEPDGKTMVGSTAWQTYLANGKPKNDYRAYDLVQGKGWYTNAGYAVARLDSGFPFAPVSGSWTIKYRCESYEAPAVSECLVTVDPNFHTNNKGTILFQTTSSSESQRTLTINPAQFGPGAHKLVIRASVAQLSGSTNAGVLAIPFTVP